jgi:hypothetical protein
MCNQASKKELIKLDEDNFKAIPIILISNTDNIPLLEIYHGSLSELLPSPSISNHAWNAHQPINPRTPPCSKYILATPNVHMNFSQNHVQMRHRTTEACRIEKTPNLDIITDWKTKIN